MNSLSKNQLKNLAGYRMLKRCDEEGVFVVEGVKMCDEALRSGYAIRAVCGTVDYVQTHNEALTHCGGEVYEVNDEQLERLSSQRTPNKVWMLMERRTESGEWESGSGERLILALDGLQDPGNMGTILRTADWYGIRHIVCSRNTVSCYNPKVVQSTMGAIFRTKIMYCDLAEWMDKAEEMGAAVYGATLDGKPYQNAAVSHPAVLVIGNEGHGISPSIASRIKHKITIPNIGGTCESLNAAVATAILVSEFYR